MKILIAVIFALGLGAAGGIGFDRNYVQHDDRDLWHARAYELYGALHDADDQLAACLLDKGTHIVFPGDSVVRLTMVRPLTAEPRRRHA